MPATHHATLRVREGDIIWLAKIKGASTWTWGFQGKNPMIGHRELGKALLHWLCFCGLDFHHFLLLWAPHSGYVSFRN